MGGQGMGQGRRMNPGEAHAVSTPGGQPGQPEEPNTQSPPNKPGQYEKTTRKAGDRLRSRGAQRRDRRAQHIRRTEQAGAEGPG